MFSVFYYVSLCAIRIEGMAQQWRRAKKHRKIILEENQVVLAFDVGQINMAECMLRVNLQKRPPFDIIHWALINLEKGSVCNTVKSMCTLINDGSKSHWKEADHIIIEQQARVNVKMISLSHALQACLLMYNPKASPVFVSSVHKFNIYRQMPLFDQSLVQDIKTTGSSVYLDKKRRKQSSINITNTLMEAYPDNACAHGYHVASKQDDLADCMIYASAFIYKNEPFA